MIILSNVYKKYIMGEEELCVLKDINLKIEQGEFVAVKGPSGSGKSTLMNLIGGLDRPTEGEVNVGGENIGRYNDITMSKYRNEKVGFIFQSFNLENSFTAIENVMLPLMFRGVSEKERERRAKEILCRVGLEDRMFHRPTQLSGGQRQRVSIARALIGQPKILLADEPTGNLDSKTGTLIMELLQEINNEGYTIIMVTHNDAEANKSSRIIEIFDGVIK